METEQKLIEIKVKAEDVIRSLELVICQAEAGVIRAPAARIHAASPELFDISLALVRASKAAETAKAELLKLIGLPADTRFLRVQAVP